MCVGVSGSCNFALRWQCCIWLEKQPLAADMKGQVIVIAHRIVYLLFSYLPLVIVMSNDSVLTCLPVQSHTWEDVVPVLWLATTRLKCLILSEAGGRMLTHTSNPTDCKHVHTSLQHYWQGLIHCTQLSLKTFACHNVKVYSFFFN